MMPISSANVADLRDAHLGMLREPPDGQVVRHFIGRVARAGAFATVEEDRQVLQKILVHWTARAIRDGNMMLGDAPKLEPFRPDAPPETAEQSSESAAMAIALPTPEEIEKARRRVRISATAEEWKKLGGDGSPVAQGYLLSGEALERARAFIADSATIAELVGASDRDLAETQQALAKSKIVTLRRWLAVVVVVGALVVGLIYQAMTKATATASAKDAEAREARDRAGILLAENEDLKGQINAANRRLQELSSEIDSSKTDTGFTGDVLSQLRDVLPPPPSSALPTTSRPWPTG